MSDQARSWDGGSIDALPVMLADIEVALHSVYSTIYGTHMVSSWQTLKRLSVTFTSYMAHTLPNGFLLANIKDVDSC